MKQMNWGRGRTKRQTRNASLMVAAALSVFIGSDVWAHDDHTHGSATEAAEDSGASKAGADSGHSGEKATTDDGHHSGGDASVLVLGPNEGKILTEVIPHAEIFVTQDRKVQITFLNDEGEILPPADQTIVVHCGQRNAPTRMSFEKTETSFLSDKTLPDGMNIPTVLQVQMTPESEKTTVRLNLNLATCEECERPEYTCVCHPEEHIHGPGGHSHSHDGKSHSH